MNTLKKLTPAALLTLSLLVITPTESFAIAKSDKHKARADRYKASADKHRERPDKHSRRSSNQLKQAEIKEAEARLAEMGYGTGPVDGVIDGVTRNALMCGFSTSIRRNDSSTSSRGCTSRVRTSSASEAALIAASTFSGATVVIRTDVSSRTRFTAAGR